MSVEKCPLCGSSNCPFKLMPNLDSDTITCNRYGLTFIVTPSLSQDISEEERAKR